MIGAALTLVQNGAWKTFLFLFLFLKTENKSAAHKKKINWEFNEDYRKEASEIS